MNPVKIALRVACLNLLEQGANLPTETEAAFPSSMAEWADRGDRALQCGNRRHHISWNRTGGYPMLIGPKLTEEQRAEWYVQAGVLLGLAKWEDVRHKHPDFEKMLREF